MRLVCKSMHFLLLLYHKVDIVTDPFFSEFHRTSQRIEFYWNFLYLSKKCWTFIPVKNFLNYSQLTSKMDFRHLELCLYNVYAQL